MAVSSVWPIKTTWSTLGLSWSEVFEIVSSDVLTLLLREHRTGDESGKASIAGSIEGSRRPLLNPNEKTIV